MTSPALQALEAVLASLAAARVRVEQGGVPDLAPLLADVEKAVAEIHGLPPKEAGIAHARLMGLLDEIAALTKAVTGAHARTREELRRLHAHRQASQLYDRGKNKR